jgi:hypothetical protein
MKKYSNLEIVKPLNHDIKTRLKSAIALPQPRKDKCHTGAYAGNPDPDFKPISCTPSLPTWSLINDYDTLSIDFGR